MRQVKGWNVVGLWGIILALSFVLGCGKSSGDSAPPASISVSPSHAAADGSSSTVGSTTLTKADATRERPKSKAPTIVSVETSKGTFKIRLFDDKAPRTVENFLENYVARNFYDQTIVHHAERGFMVAAGGYTADMQPLPTRAWIRNESNNGLSNRRGTVAMARHPDYPHSATSQFFINVVDNPSLDYHAPQEGEITDESYGYCVFGEVIEGMDVVDQIANVPVTAKDVFPSVPVEAVVIKSIRKVQP